MKLAYGLLAALSLSVNAEYLYPVVQGQATVRQEPVMGGIAQVQTVPILTRVPSRDMMHDYARERTTYRYIEVENMPCILVEYGGYQEGSKSITCDWRKWQGDSFAEKLRRN